MLEVVNYINNNIIWGVPLLAALSLAGVYFSFKYRFIGFRPVKMFRELFRRDVTAEASDGNLSPFQTLTAALGVTLGTGNIIALGAGMAIGGAGALFWMVVSSMFGAATAYAETYYGMKYRGYGGNGKSGGFGAIAYIEKATGRVPAKVYAALCLLASFGVGSAAQLGAAAAALRDAFNTPRYFTGITIALAVAVIMFGGAQFFGKFTEKVIPGLSLLYITACIAVICINYTSLPAVFGEIFRSAFTLRGGAGGAVGVAFMWGIRRGVFSNEAGLGTAVFFTSLNSTDSPKRAAGWGALTVYIDTAVISLLTGVAMLSAGADRAGIPGELYANYTFAALPFGSGFVAVAVALFALCTCAGWSVFGSRSAEYLFGRGTGKWYCALFVVSAYAGAVTDAPLLLGIADMFNGAMALPNLAALYVLRRD